MSAGHRHKGYDGPIDRERAKELGEYFKDPKFKTALARYDTEDDKHDIPYLGGSDNAGTTIYFDRRLPLPHEHKLPYDPRQFLRIHESVEGVLLRAYGLTYTQAHDLATIAERQAVEAAGHRWKQYSEMLEPYIRADEKETADNPPDDLLLNAYKGTPWFAKLRAEQE